MKACVMKFLFIGVLSTFLLAGIGLPVHSGTFFDQLFADIVCIPDNNESSVTATEVTWESEIYDIVCPNDQFDWYRLPLKGALTWCGMIGCVTDDVGLAVKLYYDSGSGLEQITEGAPTEMDIQGNIVYVLVLDIHEIALDMGYMGTPPGDYYLRVTYYNPYPGEHPYMLQFDLGPTGFNPSPFNNSTTAKPLPPEKYRFGHLNSEDSSDWYTFEVAPSQFGTGIILAEEVDKYKYPSSGEAVPLTFNQPRLPAMYDIVCCSSNPSNYDFMVNLRALDESFIATAYVEKWDPSFMDLGAENPLYPGTYYIEVTLGPLSPSGKEFDYMLLNRALTPAEAPWWFDGNNDTASAVPLQEGFPVDGSICWPRDEVDYLHFTSPGPCYFLGDILMEPPPKSGAMHGYIYNKNGDSFPARRIPGVGFSSRYCPAPSGPNYIVLVDDGRMLSPVNYNLTLYLHGVPITEPAGHNTWETALEMKSMHGPPGGLKVAPGDAVVDFKPGVQDLFFTTMVVPEEKYLVGYYDVYGSRPDFQVSLGRLGPGGTPVWSPAMSPNSKGKLTIDMNYEFFSEAGTYYLKIKMLPSSPGQMRMLVANYSRITECVADDNNAPGEALNLRLGYQGFGELCPLFDQEDWFFFHTSLFDAQIGSKEKLSLRGGVGGMKMSLYNKNNVLLKTAEVNDVGEVAVIDLKGFVEPDEKYYVVVLANTQEDRVQIYDLTLRKDIYINIGSALKYFEKPKFHIKPGLILRSGGDD